MPGRAKPPLVVTPSILSSWLVYPSSMHSLRILAVALASLAVGCTKPDPPVLTPKSAVVSKVSTAGIDMQLSVDAYNPNAIELSAQSFSGKVVLDGKSDLGAVSSAKPVVLPAGAHTLIAVPVTATWSDLGSVAALVAQSGNVTYAFEGTAAVGGERLNVNVPFHVEGTITHAQLVQATLGGLPALPQFLK